MLGAVVAVVVLGLVAWGAWVRLAAEPAPPAARPPASAPSSSVASGAAGEPEVEVSEGPPLFVRYPSRLEGTWTADSGRLVLVVANARLTLTDVTHYRSLRYIRVEGHRVHVQPSGDDAELATYRWAITHDRLTFRLLDRTPDATLRLERLTFHRRA